MSKTRQRKEAAFQQGCKDGQTGFGIRWKTHPFLADYMQGYRAARMDVMLNAKARAAKRLEPDLDRENKPQ